MKSGGRAWRPGASGRVVCGLDRRRGASTWRLSARRACVARALRVSGTGAPCRRLQRRACFRVVQPRALPLPRILGMARHGGTQNAARVGDAGPAARRGADGLAEAFDADACVYSRRRVTPSPPLPRCAGGGVATLGAEGWCRGTRTATPGEITFNFSVLIFELHIYCYVNFG